MNIRQLTKNDFLIFDGAMGTMMQKKGLLTGDLPEILNMTHPEMILEIHKEYVNAGANVVSTNTFQASEYKLKDCGYSVEEIISNAVSIGKKSGANYVALDVGPVGRLMQPLGDMSFDDAYNFFKRQMIAGENAGADLILIETFSDLYEAKAAILAAKENTTLPVIVSMTYQEDGRTFTGTDPITATITLQSLGVDALGLNCSMGPKELLPLVEDILLYSKVPVIVQANAGLPKIENDETIYTISSKEYSGYVENLLLSGVKIIGGCCGTTPEFIKDIKEVASKQAVVNVEPLKVSAVTSSSKTVFFDNNITVIGERINPTGKPKLKEALKENRIDYIISEAIDQVKAGADVLDINVGLPEIDEAEVIKTVIKNVQEVTALPIQVDSSDPVAIEAGVRIFNGKPIINSVNGKKESMENIFPIVKKYGAVVVGLTLDESGIPDTAEGRYRIAEKIVNTAKSYGIPAEDILIDCLTLTASAQQDNVLATLDAIKLVKARLKVKTVLGVSNVSFGLPSRALLNSTFLSAAMGAGLDAPILNPLSLEMMQAIDTFRVINNQDKGCIKFIDKYSESIDDKKQKETHTSKESKDAIFEDFNALIEMIIDGRKDDVAISVTKLLNLVEPLRLIDECFIPALNIVGDGFEKGETFLPSLMMSAEAVKSGFGVIKSFEGQRDSTSVKGKILLATVLGDIHDIGKNIAKMLLENYGYEVIDLGKDVPINVVVLKIKEENIKLVGLSALMTTTVKNMKETINVIRSSGLDCTIMVGGAVLNSEYAEFVGADYYVKDARDGVEVAKKVFNVT